MQDIMYGVSEEPRHLISRPEESLYKTIYAPVDVGGMLASADTRSRIRRLPPLQLYFGLKELSDEEIGQLVPHVTPEQWQAVLDLDLWSRDQASVGQFINLQRHLLLAEDAVARKIVGAADPDLWELAFHRLLRIYPKVEDDVEGDPPEGEVFMTPDDQYLMVLPDNPEVARLVRALLTRLYELDSNWVRLRLESARFRTPSELRESAYEARTRRVEEMGFQDYYQAVEVYSPLATGEELPRKRTPQDEVSTLPGGFRPDWSGPLLLMQAFATLSRSQEISHLLEELFFVCNKVLTADRISPAEPRLIKRGIRKALTGMNLGLELVAEGKPERALAAVQEHYLQSLFRLAYTRLLTLKARAGAVRLHRQIAPGSPDDVWLKGLERKYPGQAISRPGASGIVRRFFSTRREVEEAEKRLDELEK